MKLSGVVTRDGVRYRAGQRIWEPADDEQLRTLYPDTPTPDVARALGRSICAIYGRVGTLNLRKSAAYLAGPHAYRLRRGDNVGKAYRFAKGHVPANKGMRRPGWGPGRMKATQFKKGQCSGQAARHLMPLGSTRLIDGYLYRKVSAVRNVPYSVNWKPEHYLLWIAAYGPVPNGHKLRFVDGDRTHVWLENLELVTAASMMRRNSIHNLPPELDKTIQLLGALNRQIRRRNASQEQDGRSA